MTYVTQKVVKEKYRQIARSAYASGRYQAGFTLVELAVAIVVIGVMAAASAVMYLGLLSSVGGKDVADSHLVSLSGSVVTFVKNHNRLPCPDTNGSGYEALSGGVCPDGTAVGWLPYISLGLSPPAAKERAIYGVYRNAPTADLAVSATLNTLTAAAVAAQAGASSNFVYVTGDGTTTNGAEDCSGMIASNPAYVILAAGEDRDGDGNNVDGINNSLPGSGRCFSAPSRGIDTRFDDRTYAMSFYGLMAELNR